MKPKYKIWVGSNLSVYEFIWNTENRWRKYGIKDEKSRVWVLEEVLQKTWLPVYLWANSSGHSLPTLFPVLGMYILYTAYHPHSGSCHKDIALRVQCLWYLLDSICDSNKLKASVKTSRFGKKVWLSPCLAATQDRPPMQGSLFIKSSICLSGLVCLFLWSLPTLHVKGPVSNFTQEAPKVAN